MNDTHHWRMITDQNRTYWEAIAADRPGEPIEFFLSGNSALDEAELRLLGDVAGKRVLQLASAIGDEAISFALSGAQVTAVDISSIHVRAGRAKSEAIGVQVELREGDMMALDHDLTAFDVVYICSGGICWVPDIDAWARQVAGRLNPSGTLLVSEHHPLWEVLSVSGDDCLRVSDDYFGTARSGYGDPTKAPQVAQDRICGLPEPHSFVWGLGRVVTAVAQAGLQVTALEEFAAEDMYDGLDSSSAAKIPSAYRLAATRR